MLVVVVHLLLEVQDVAMHWTIPFSIVDLGVCTVISMFFWVVPSWWWRSWNLIGHHARCLVLQSSCQVWCESEALTWLCWCWGLWSMHSTWNHIGGGRVLCCWCWEHSFHQGCFQQVEPWQWWWFLTSIWCERCHSLLGEQCGVMPNILAEQISRIDCEFLSLSIIVDGVGWTCWQWNLNLCGIVGVVRSWDEIFKLLIGDCIPINGGKQFSVAQKEVDAILQGVQFTDDLDSTRSSFQGGSWGGAHCTCFLTFNGVAINDSPQILGCSPVVEVACKLVEGCLVALQQNIVDMCHVWLKSFLLHSWMALTWHDLKILQQPPAQLRMPDFKNGQINSENVSLNPFFMQMLKLNSVSLENVDNRSNFSLEI